MAIPLKIAGRYNRSNKVIGFLSTLFPLFVNACIYKVAKIFLIPIQKSQIKIKNKLLHVSVRSFFHFKFFRKVISKPYKNKQYQNVYRHNYIQATLYDRAFYINK